MDGKMLARIGAVIFVAVALTATAIEMTREEEPAAPSLSATPAENPAAYRLRAELNRCQALGEAALREPSCLRGWAENRRRFLGIEAQPAPSITGRR